MNTGKTLPEIKDEVAERYEYQSWEVMQQSLKESNCWLVLYGRLSIAAELYANQLQGSEWISVQEAPEGSFIVCDSDCSQSYEAYHFLISNEWYHHNKLVKPAYYREWPNPPQSK